MKKKLFLSVIVVSFVIVGCFSKVKKNDMDKFLNTLRFIRENPNFGFSDEQKLNRGFYRAILGYRFEGGIERVEKYLNNDCSPDYCYGECGWIESNPLLLFSQLTYSTYYHHIAGDDIPSPPPDVQLLLLLLRYKADIDYYPYIYAIVYRKGNRNWDTNEEMVSFVLDCNRILNAFLDNGADVNKKGHPYPFSYESPDDMTYEDVYKYFNSSEATTPLYEAIKKGIVWESQVDLLLEYGATLDETCLEAARLSGDEEMVEKINKLWENRNK